ncbi:hypothetical protein GCM10023189_51770 [Nibrella saemangeumensis]|uniref:Uncharacterized protein n=1 Tax=Nibrella saemangeumensis TaxID=1084526 RepID=A0ABP8NI74_9BACT
MSLVTHRDIPNLTEYYYTIGILAKNALGDLESECQSITYYIDIIPEFIPELVFKPRPLPDPLPFVDPEVYFGIALGAALHEANLVMVERNEMKDEELLKTLRSGAQSGLQVFLKEYEQHGRELKKRIR